MSDKEAMKREPRKDDPLNPKCTGYDIRIWFHSQDAEKATDNTEKVRQIVGAALDALGIQEEIDYTLEVARHYL